MFIEPIIKEGKRGWIEVICGSMFSGKTEELIRRLRLAKISHLQTAIFKPEIDTRFDSKNIISHDESMLQSIPVKDSISLLRYDSNIDVVGIDEAQFFDEGLPDACDQLANRGIRVIVAGLDMDFRGKPYGPMPNLLAKADYITKLHAICMQCGNIAGFTYRKTGDTEQFILGEKSMYEPRCRACFFKSKSS